MVLGPYTIHSGDVVSDCSCEVQPRFYSKLYVLPYNSPDQICKMPKPESEYKGPKPLPGSKLPNKLILRLFRV